LYPNRAVLYIPPPLPSRRACMANACSVADSGAPGNRTGDRAFVRTLSPGPDGKSYSTVSWWNSARRVAATPDPPVSVRSRPVQRGRVDRSSARASRRSRSSA